MSRRDACAVISHSTATSPDSNDSIRDPGRRIAAAARSKAESRTSSATRAPNSRSPKASRAAESSRSGTESALAASWFSSSPEGGWSFTLASFLVATRRRAVNKLGDT